MTITAQSLPRASHVGLLGAILLTLGSFGGGAIRNRGGVLEALGLDFLSYGHGAGLSNTVFFIGMVLLVVAWALLGRQSVFGQRFISAAGPLHTVRRTLWLWLIPLLFAAPMLSRDVYSYLMQGAMVRDGFDPYVQGAAVNPGPMLLEVSHDWRNTTTPYGPLHLWIGEWVTRVVGDNVTVGVILYKLISVAGFAAVIWAVPRIAMRLGGNPATALWLGVANPVMVLHLVGGMHNESLMVGLVSVGLLLALRNRFLAGVALIAVAVSLKATAAIALPFVVWLAVNHFGGSFGVAAHRVRRFWAFLISGAVGALETLAVVAAVTWLSGSSWGWLSEISGNSKVINPLAAPSLLAGLISPYFRIFDEDFSYNTALAVLRTIFMVAMVVGLIITWWLFRQNDRRAVMGVTAAYSVAFVFNSVTLPWYYASVISLVGTYRPPLWLLKLAAGASMVVGLSFSGSGNHQLYNFPLMIVLTLAAWLLTAFVFAETERESGARYTPTEQPGRRMAGTA
ncbi:alpha-(1-_6)-mannopyranosyltransferase A [Corynebacterium halotolerans]|uniref:alpha-(1->6)-mannopyranosyltransferase A n=1 Tax=Corynebacterium halotolerans TaxID=225326 RepID=UPI003CF96E20